MMPSEFDLLHSLDDEPRTPSTVDIGRAIADGRRRQRARRVAGYTGAAAVTALAVAGASVAGGLTPRVPPGPVALYTIPGTAGWTAAPAAPPTRCTLSRLPVPDNAPTAVVTGADPTGRYIVGRSDPKDGSSQAVIWHDGKGRKVMLPGEVEKSLSDVNSAGTAVGWSYADDRPVPYVYQDGEVAKLPGVRHGSANAINEAGAIVGDDHDNGHPLVWPSATAKPIQLPVPAGTARAAATGIDEDGTTVGTLDDKRPYVWFPDGTHRELAMPTLDGEPAAAAWVFSIRNGWATGLAARGAGRDGSKPAPSATSATGEKAADPVREVRWQVRTGEVRENSKLQMPSRIWESIHQPSTTNAHGWRAGADEQGRAVLVADAATVVLPDLAAHDQSHLANSATTLSDDGRTIGGQSDAETGPIGKIQAVVWRCR